VVIVEIAMWTFVGLCGVGLCVAVMVLWGNLIDLNQQVQRLEADARRELAERKRQERSEAALKAQEAAEKPKIVKPVSMRMMVR